MNDRIIQDIIGLLQGHRAEITEFSYKIAIAKDGKRALLLSLEADLSSPDEPAEPAKRMRVVNQTLGSVDYPILVEETGGEDHGN